MTIKQKRRAALLAAWIDAQRWIEDHGGSRAAYIARYGSATDPHHYGAGGEAIWQADVAAAQRAEAAYLASR